MTYAGIFQPNPHDHQSSTPMYICICIYVYVYIYIYIHCLLPTVVLHSSLFILMCLAALGIDAVAAVAAGGQRVLRLLLLLPQGLSKFTKEQSISNQFVCFYVLVFCLPYCYCYWNIMSSHWTH